MFSVRTNSVQSDSVQSRQCRVTVCVDTVYMYSLSDHTKYLQEGYEGTERKHDESIKYSTTS